MTARQIAAVLIVAATGAVAAQQPSQGLPHATRVMSDLELTHWGESAIKQEAASGKALDYLFNSYVRTKIPLYYDTPALPPSVEILEAPALRISAHGPMAAVQMRVRESARRQEPLGTLSLLPIVGVVVSPLQIDAPDIDKVVLRRDGTIIAPVSDGLKPQEMTTRMGARAVVHSGVITYPVAAFGPGATVVITAIPVSGRNVEKRFSEQELTRITWGYIFQ